MATQAQREHMKHLMDFLYAHRAKCEYPPHDRRGPLDVRTFMMTEQHMEHVLTGGGTIMADCSEMVTEVCRWAGLADPNGLHYRYAGYTGTLLSNLKHHYTNAEAAGVGALVVFGPGTGEHVSMVYKPGKDPVLQSHGRSGMDRWHLSEQRVFHSPPVTFLEISHL